MLYKYPENIIKSVQQKIFLLKKIFEKKNIYCERDQCTMERNSPNFEDDAPDEVKIEVEVEGWDINPILFFTLLICILATQKLFSFVFSPQGIATLVFAFAIYKVIKLILTKGK